MTDLDAMIAKAHSAAEDTENQARQIEARICRIPGAAMYLPVRRYGSEVDPAAIRRNATLSSLIARHDHELACFLGVATADRRRRNQEAAILRAIRAAALSPEQRHRLLERLRSEGVLI